MKSIKMKDLRDMVNKNLDRAKKANKALSYYKEIDSIEDIGIFDLISILGGNGRSPQKNISILEKKLSSLNSWKRVKASDNRGDYVDKDGKYFELKTSFTNDAQCINLDQIRPWQKVNYYRAIYIDFDSPDDSVSYIIPKDDIVELCKNASATHGTKTINESNVNIEKSLRISISDKKFDKYKENFWEK